MSSNRARNQSNAANSNRRKQGGDSARKKSNSSTRKKQTYDEDSQSDFEMEQAQLDDEVMAELEGLIDEPISAKKKRGNNNTRSTRKNQGAEPLLSGLEEVKSVPSKKRHVSQISSSFVSKGTGKSSTSSFVKRAGTQIASKHLESQVSRADANSDQLWLLKYKPQCMEELVVHKKKVQEFAEMVTDPKTKILILSGPSGSAKNTLVETFCSQNEKEFVKFSDTKNEYLPDVFGNDKGKQISNDGAIYPEDLENLLDFIRLQSQNSMKSISSSGQSKVGKTSFLAGGSSFRTKSAKAQPSQKEARNNFQQTAISKREKILVVRSLPECLKIASIRRHQFLRDFNECLNILIRSQQKTPVLIFIFSDQNERTQSFLNRVFSQELMSRHKNSGVIKTLVVNSITDANIEKVLNYIIYQEKIKINALKLAEIRNQSNKDLRNAITTLQFYSVGNLKSHQMMMMHENGSSNGSSQLKMRKLNNGTSSDVDMQSDNSNSNQPKSTSKKTSKPNNQSSHINGRDQSISMFHAFGRFLYNKRIHPKYKRPEQLPYDIMKKNPKYYYKHIDILEQAPCEKSSVSLYLHQNMLNFFNDIGEVADCLEVYSDCDNAQSQLTYSFNHQQYLYEIDEVNSLICSLAITETNKHVLSKNQDKRKMYTMQKPQYFDHVKDTKQNKLLIKDYAKDEQLLQQKLISEDLLLRSRREIQSNILPYLSMMGVEGVSQDLKDLCTFVKGGEKFGSRFETFKADDELGKDNFNREQQIEDYQRQKQREKNRSQKMKQVGTHTMMEIDQVKNCAFANQNKDKNNNHGNGQQDDDEDNMLLDMNEEDLDALMNDLSIEEQIENSD